MTTVTEATMAASVILGLISIPAVSQTAATSGPLQADMPNISTSSESMPKQVSRTTSPDGFQASIETAFDKFTADISQDSASASLETPGSDLDMEKSSEGVEWRLSTPEGELILKQSSQKAVETVKTPQGTLKTVKQNGGVTTEFEGSNRELVEQARSSLRTQLDQRKQKMDDKRNQLRQQSLPSVELIANETTASGHGNNSQEYIVVVNEGYDKLDLEGWRVQNDRPDSYSFGGVQIESGEKLRVYSGQEEDVSFDGTAIYNTGLSWRNSGDTATLMNEEGVQIAEEGY